MGRSTRMIWSQMPLTMPECDDESSESDHEPDFGGHGGRDDDGDDDGDDDDENQRPSTATDAVAFKWDGVGDIQALKLKNSELVTTIQEYKHQVNELHVLLDAIEPIPGLDVNTLKDVMVGGDLVDHDIRDVKIVHMAKKLRQLKVALNNQTTRGAGAAHKIAELEMALHEASENVLKGQRQIQKLQLLGGAPEPKAEKEGNNPNVVPVKKFDELKQKLEALAIELKKTQRALQKEVGDDVALADILESSESGKRGRAQQIVMLKAKVKKLEKEVAASAPPSDHLDMRVDAKAEQELLALKHDKQKQLDQVTADMESFKDATEKLSRKYDAQKARLQVLEKEAGKNKTRVSVLLEKSKNDDALIDALHREMDDLRTKSTKALRARTADSSMPPKATANDEIESLRALCADQKRQLAHHEATIESFRRDLHVAEKSQLKSFGKTESPQQANYHALAIEKERLTELVKSLTQQLTEAKKASPGPPVLPPPKPESRSRLPRLNDHAPTPPPAALAAEIERLRRAVEAKDEEIATWKEAYEQASSGRMSAQNSRLVADLEAENERLRDHVNSLLPKQRASNGS
ncbi:Aste57867_14490 [Aphanomyces stellatus]|uniref:Aste57867_14490 protein n=1 Tax=Aphanomyces stellatus TaxID=120398 RepID=A0A485L2G9_9STRA|nr:hypothetical protein As57867_014436 [Aphanomyces stellatus]VFT91312.1 Aste57867_14490 [Aphanomyces stellatus]